MEGPNNMMINIHLIKKIKIITNHLCVCKLEKNKKINV